VGYLAPCDVDFLGTEKYDILNFMGDLVSSRCDACNNLTPKLTSEQIADFRKQVKDWKVVNDHHILKKWNFENFLKPLGFVNAVAEIAELEGHHPNINFSWGYVEITIWTHAIDGLSKNDFILAAKIDAITF